MHPKTVIYNGITYSVNVDRSSNGEIEWFNVVDPDGEFVLEMDWKGDFTADDVIHELVEVLSSEEKDYIVDNGHKTRHESESTVIESEPGTDFTGFDLEFEYLSDYPDDFKRIVMHEISVDKFDSKRHRNIWVDELVEDYDDNPEEFMNDYKI